MSDPQQLLLQSQQKLQQQIIPMKYPQQLMTSVSQTQQTYPSKIQSQLANNSAVVLGGLNQLQQQQQQQQKQQSLIFHRPQQKQQQNIIILGSQSKQSVGLLQNQTIMSNQVKNNPMQQQNQSFSRSVVHHHTYNPIYPPAGQQQQQQQPLIQTITQTMPTAVTGPSSTVQIHRINSHHHILKHSQTLPIIENGSLMGSQITIPSNPSSSRNIQQISSPRVLMRIAPIQQQQQQQAQEQQQNQQRQQFSFQQFVQLAQNTNLPVQQAQSNAGQQQQQQKQRQQQWQQQQQQQQSTQISGITDQQQQQQYNSNSSQLEYQNNRDSLGVAVTAPIAERTERITSDKSKGIEELIIIIDQSEQEGNQSIIQEEKDHGDSYVRINTNQGNKIERLSEDNNNKGDSSQRSNAQSIQSGINQVTNQGVGYEEETAEIHSQNAQQLEGEQSVSNKDTTCDLQPQVQQEQEVVTTEEISLNRVEEEQSNRELQCQVTEIPPRSTQSQEETQLPAESAELLSMHADIPPSNQQDEAQNIKQQYSQQECLPAQESQANKMSSSDELRQNPSREPAILQSSLPKTKGNKQYQTQESNQISENIDIAIQDPSSHRHHHERQHSEPPFRFSSQFIPAYVPHYKTQTLLSLDSAGGIAAEDIDSQVPEVLKKIKTSHEFNPEKIASTLQAARMIHSELKVAYGKTQQEQLVVVEMEQKKGDILNVKADQQQDNTYQSSSGVKDLQYYQKNALGQQQTVTNPIIADDHGLGRTTKTSTLVNGDNLLDAMGKGEAVKQVLESNSCCFQDNGVQVEGIIADGKQETNKVELFDEQRRLLEEQAVKLKGKDVERIEKEEKKKDSLGKIEYLQAEESKYAACLQEAKDKQEQQSSVVVVVQGEELACIPVLAVCSSNLANNNAMTNQEGSKEVISREEQQQKEDNVQEYISVTTTIPNQTSELTVSLQLTSVIAGNTDDQMVPLQESTQEIQQVVSIHDQNSTELKDNLVVAVVDTEKNLKDAVVDLNATKNVNEVNKEELGCQSEIKEIDHQTAHKNIDHQKEEAKKHDEELGGDAKKKTNKEYGEESDTQDERMQVRKEEDYHSNQIDQEKAAQNREDQGQSDVIEVDAGDQKEEAIIDRIRQYHQQEEDEHSQLVQTIQYQLVTPQPSHAAAHLEVIHEEETTLQSEPSVVLLLSSNNQPPQSTDSSHLLMMASDSLQFSPSKIIIQSYTNEFEQSLVKQSNEQSDSVQQEQLKEEGEEEKQVKQEQEQAQQKNNEQQQCGFFNLVDDGSLITSMNVASADKVQGQLLQQLLQSDFSGNLLLASPQRDIIESQEQTENNATHDAGIGNYDQVVTTEMKNNDSKSNISNHRSCLLEQLRNLHAQTRSEKEGRDQKEEEEEPIIQAAQLLCIPNSNLIESSEAAEIKVQVNKPFEEEVEVEVSSGRGNVVNKEETKGKGEDKDHLTEGIDSQSANNNEGNDLVKLQQLISEKTSEIRTQIENIQQTTRIIGYAVDNHADGNRTDEINDNNMQTNQNECANIPDIAFLQLENLIDHKMQALMAKLASHAGGGGGAVRDVGKQKQDEMVVSNVSYDQEKRNKTERNNNQEDKEQKDKMQEQQQQQQDAEDKSEEENIKQIRTHDGFREDDKKMRLKEEEEEENDGVDNDNQREKLEDQANDGDENNDEEDQSPGLINVYSAHRLELEELIIQQKQNQESDQVGERRIAIEDDDSKKKNASIGISKSASSHTRVRFSNSFPHKNQDNNLSENQEDQQESQGIAPGDDEDDTDKKATSDQQHHNHHRHHHYSITHKQPASLLDPPVKPHNSIENKQYYSFKFGKQNAQLHISRFAQSASLSCLPKMPAGTSPRLIVSSTKEIKQPMHYFTAVSRKLKTTQSENNNSNSQVTNSTKSVTPIPFSSIALFKRNHNNNQNSSSSSISNVSATQPIKNKLDHVEKITKHSSSSSNKLIQKSAAINLSRISERSYMPTMNSLNNGQSSMRNSYGNATTQETKTIMLLQQTSSSGKIKGKDIIKEQQQQVITSNNSNNSTSRIKSSSSNHSTGDTSKKRLAQLQQQILEIENQIKDLNEEHSEVPNNDDNLPVDSVNEQLNKIQTEESLYSQASPIQTNFQNHLDDAENKNKMNNDNNNNTHSVHSQMSSSSKQLHQYPKQMPNSPPGSSYKQTRVNRLYYMGMLQDQRKKEIRLRIQSEDKIKEDRQCPFSPTLYTSKESRKTVPDDFQQRQQQWLQGKEQHQTKLRESQSAESFRECTFKPELFPRIDASKDSTFVEHFYLEISKLKQKKRLQGIHSQSPLSKSSGFQSSYSSKKFYLPPSTLQSASSYHFRAASSTNNQYSKSQQQSGFNSVRQRLSFNKDIQPESR